MLADVPRSALADPALLTALERAAGAMARLDQALDNHPLLPAFLYRARLEAVRRQAAVDGSSIDPWSLAAVLEGLRLRMDHELRIVDRGAIFEAARTALALHQWLTEPDFDQEGAVQAAERHLAAGPSSLIGAAEGFWSWLDQGGARPPIRAALLRFWTQHRFLRAPVPLTGPLALNADAFSANPNRLAVFLTGLAEEATDALELLRSLEHGWRAARLGIGKRRSTSRAAAAVDLLAAAPLISATTLAHAIGMSIKSATDMLDAFVRDEIVVEVTHRSARRLFGLAGMAPVRNVSAPPRRPVPGRGRGRPPLLAGTDDVSILPSAPPATPLTRFERPDIDYVGLEEAMANLDAVIKRTRQTLSAVPLTRMPYSPTSPSREDDIDQTVDR